MAKYLIILTLIFLSSCGSNDDSNVYVCISSGAYAYHHDKDCDGLNQCTHEIRTMTKEEAENDYGREVCGME
jgi:hypothetical protein